MARGEQIHDLDEDREDVWCGTLPEYDQDIEELATGDDLWGKAQRAMGRVPWPDSDDEDDSNLSKYLDSD